MSEPDTNLTPKIAYVFPGQGSQTVGMGYELYQSSRQAREAFEEADEALQFPLSKLCFEGPEEELRETINSQPAILTVSIACLRASEIDGTIKPVFVAGHSLGEYTALVAANVLGFADAVRLVRERGRLMYEAAGEANIAVRVVSFKGSLQALRSWEPHLNQAQISKKERFKLISDLYDAMTNTPIRQRPGRSEPRCVKRRPKNYQRMTVPRSEMKEIPHRNRYRATTP